MKLYDKVKDLLTKYPTLRDSDRLLIWNVWGVSGYIKGGAITKEDFLKAPHMESIRRVRQKIQEQYPALASSPGVQSAKDNKEKKKGNFVYKETIFEKKGHWDYSGGNAVWIEEI